MVLIIKTISDGEITSGFHEKYIEFIKLGDYTFSTRNLAKTASLFGTYHNNIEDRLYNFDGLMDLDGEYMSGLIKIASKSNPDANDMKISVDRLQKRYARKCLEKKTCEYKGGIIRATIIVDESSIRIGEYVITSLDFGKIAQYIARGGENGWPDGNRPNFAEVLNRSILDSRRPFYRPIRDELYKSSRSNFLVQFG